MTRVAVRVFATDTVIKTQEDKKNLLPKIYKQGWREPQHHTIMDITSIHTIPSLALVVPTEENNIVIVDFDIQEDFDLALLINQALPPNEQCNYIVKSTRKGGHFYFDNKDNISTRNISTLHSTKGVKVDIQGIGHNVIAPTAGDPSKVLITPLENDLTLRPISPLFLHFLNTLIVGQSEPQDKKVLLAAKETYSDDNYSLIMDYLNNTLAQETFLNYYNLPKTIPVGQSYSILQKLAMRLLCDETLSHEIVLAVMAKYDPDNRQDHKALCPANENKYVDNKQDYTLTLQHSMFHTSISIYYDRHTGDHIIQYSKEDGEPKVLTINSESRARALIEKMVRLKRGAIKWHTIRDVDVIATYTKPGGFNRETKTFNTSYMNSYLAAFKGTKPPGYTVPHKLIEMLHYMWGEEFDYLLCHTRWRYNTFEHSPVIHHIVGVEGSGKNLTENLLARGFSEESQELDFALFMDKHAVHHIQPNTVLGEVGDWNKIQQAEALSKIKTMSGCQGRAVVRGMQQISKVVPTINKIWVLGNDWMKLHTNPLTQRRVHAVYMPKPLTTDFGGPYTPNEIEYLVSPEVVVNFYYWLGNEYQPDMVFTKAEYQSAFCRQGSYSYRVYLEAVEGQSDRIIRLLAEVDFQKLLEALQLADKSLNDLTFKYSKQGFFVVSLQSLKSAFISQSGSTDILRALQDLCMQKDDGRLLRFDKSPEKYLTFNNAPMGLCKEEKLELKD